MLTVNAVLLIRVPKEKTIAHLRDFIMKITTGNNNKNWLKRWRKDRD